MHRLALAVVLAAVLGGLGGCAPPPSADTLPAVQALQQQAYPECVTGRFLSLADFEESSLTGQSGKAQAKQFAIEPVSDEGRLAYTVKTSRTGVGALEATLPPGAELVYRSPEVHDLADYTLLSMAIHTDQIRDDLQITIATDSSSWHSLPVLLRPGWNTVMIDLHRLKLREDFDIHRVRSIRLGFSSYASLEPGRKAPAVTIGLDDILVIDNRRDIQPVPPGVRLVKTGLDYELQLPDRTPLRLYQCDDGLWRMGVDQATLVCLPSSAGGVTAGGAADESALTALLPDPPREDLKILGSRRVGEVELLEHNALRLRIANTWFFPDTPGRWLSDSVRQARWEYTFYRDGRIISDLLVNFAGSAEVGRFYVAPPAASAFADGRRCQSGQFVSIMGTIGRVSYLTSYERGSGRLIEDNYMRAPNVEVALGQRERTEADIEGDGFDPTEGCYRLLARAGQCRFLLRPGESTQQDTYVRVRGDWRGLPSANCEGLALRDLVHLEDGSVLLVLPGPLEGPRWVEVSGSTE